MHPRSNGGHTIPKFTSGSFRVPYKTIFTQTKAQICYWKASSNTSDIFRNSNICLKQIVHTLRSTAKNVAPLVFARVAKSANVSRLWMLTAESGMKNHTHTVIIIYIKDITLEIWTGHKIWKKCGQIFHYFLAGQINYDQQFLFLNCQRLNTLLSSRWRNMVSKQSETNP